MFFLRRFVAKIVVVSIYLLNLWILLKLKVDNIDE